MAIRVGDLQLEAAEPVGRVSPALRWPQAPGLGLRFLVRAANAPGLRDLLRTLQRALPMPALRSDVEDVVYVNWLVRADALEALLPFGARVQRFGDYAVFSVLVFRHGHFGPDLLGRARSLMPSPIQCNARAYLAAPLSGHVAFLSNSINHPVYCLGARLLSDGLPAHYPAAARLERTGGTLQVAIDPGQGSALALHVSLTETNEEALPPAFAAIFSDGTAALQYLVPQNAAARRLPTIEQTCDSAIVVEVSEAAARWASVNAPLYIGAPFEALVCDAEPLAFVLPAVRFRVLSERLRDS